MCALHYARGISIASRLVHVWHLINKGYAAPRHDLSLRKHNFLSFIPYLVSHSVYRLSAYFETTQL